MTYTGFILSQFICYRLMPNRVLSLPGSFFMFTAKKVKKIKAMQNVPSVRHTGVWFPVRPFKGIGGGTHDQCAAQKTRLKPELLIDA